MTRASRPRKGRGKKESPASLRARASAILKILRGEFSRPETALGHENAYQLLVATILSAQCTDERVNKVTGVLFRTYRSAADFAAAVPAELEEAIRSTGFYRMKAKNIIACSRALVENHGGIVPERMEDLVQLAGVGRKTANVVLGQAFGIASGVVVDTHVHRLSQRLGLSAAETAEKIEEELMEVFPKKDWIDVGMVLILHGRRTCKARKPDCPSCPIRGRCPSADSFLSAPR